MGPAWAWKRLGRRQNGDFDLGIDEPHHGRLWMTKSPSWLNLKAWCSFATLETRTKLQTNNLGNSLDFAGSKLFKQKLNGAVRGDAIGKKRWARVPLCRKTTLSAWLWVSHQWTLYQMWNSRKSRRVVSCRCDVHLPEVAFLVDWSTG